MRIIVPTAPRGSIDMTARVVAAKAAMIIGAEAAAKSAPDATSCWWRMTAPWR